MKEMKNYTKAATKIEDAIKLLQEAHEELGYTIDVMTGSYATMLWVHPSKGNCYSICYPYEVNKEFNMEEWIKECEFDDELQAMLAKDEPAEETPNDEENE